MPLAKLNENPTSCKRRASGFSSDPEDEPEEDELSLSCSMDSNPNSKSAGSKPKTPYKHIPHCLKPPEVVEKRNARERKRVRAVNEAFYRLRASVPIENRNKRVSKVKTLQRAIDYIRKLEIILESDEADLDRDSSCATLHATPGSSKAPKKQRRPTSNKQQPRQAKKVKLANCNSNLAPNKQQNHSALAPTCKLNSSDHNLQLDCSANEQTTGQQPYSAAPELGPLRLHEPAQKSSGWLAYPNCNSMIEHEGQQQQQPGELAQYGRQLEYPSHYGGQPFGQANSLPAVEQHNYYANSAATGQVPFSGYANHFDWPAAASPSSRSNMSAGPNSSSPLKVTSTSSSCPKLQKTTAAGAISRPAYSPASLVGNCSPRVDSTTSRPANERLADRFPTTLSEGQQQQQQPDSTIASVQSLETSPSASSASASTSTTTNNCNQLENNNNNNSSSSSQYNAQSNSHKSPPDNRAFSFKCADNNPNQRESNLVCHSSAAAAAGANCHQHQLGITSLNCSANNLPQHNSQHEPLVDSQHHHYQFLPHQNVDFVTHLDSNQNQFNGNCQQQHQQHQQHSVFHHPSDEQQQQLLNGYPTNNYYQHQQSYHYQGHQQGQQQQLEYQQYGSQPAEFIYFARQQEQDQLTTGETATANNNNNNSHPSLLAATSACPGGPAAKVSCPKKAAPECDMNERADGRRLKTNCILGNAVDPQQRQQQIATPTTNKHQQAAISSSSPVPPAQPEPIGGSGNGTSLMLLGNNQNSFNCGNQFQQQQQQHQNYLARSGILLVEPARAEVGGPASAAANQMGPQFNQIQHQLQPQPQQHHLRMATMASSCNPIVEQHPSSYCV